MRHLALALVLIGVAAGTAAGQGAAVLATVQIPRDVLANGTPLAAGTYELRLTGERPPALVGQSPDAQAFVDIVADGEAVAREVAEVLRDATLPEEGASSQRVPTGVTVNLLNGGEFVRVSVKRDDGTRYLIHFPVPGAEQR
jgi:hypothetical protein